VYQVLTKRPARARRFLERNLDLLDGGLVRDHIWLGTSVENQSVTYRIEHLRATPVRVRFLSCEPLIGPLSFDPVGLDWVIVGGESGLQRRPMDAAWVRAIRDRCVHAGVPFFFKQWGGRTPKAGGRALDGLEWSEMPARAVGG
jgi:protein gp37